MPTISVYIPRGDLPSTTTTTSGGPVVIVIPTSKPVVYTQSSTGGQSQPTPSWCSNCGPSPGPGGGCQFGCGHGCGIFGCGGGCGIFGCGGGGCGIFGCGGSWNGGGCKRESIPCSTTLGSRAKSTPGPCKICTDSRCLLQVAPLAVDVTPAVTPLLAE
jgi:hypothetical protein